MQSHPVPSHQPVPAGHRTFGQRVGERIQSIRVERRIAQHDLAAQLGISQSRLSKYEHGVHEVPLETLVRLARLLAVSTDFLLTGHSHAALAADPRLLDRFQQIVRLGTAEREIWVGLMDGFLGVYRLFQVRAQAAARAPAPPVREGRRCGPA